MNDMTLSNDEQKKLKELVAIVNRGVKTLGEIGDALLQIKEGKLWRQNHKSFELFVKSEWGYGKSYANKLIASSELISKVGTIVPKVPRASEIKTEGQIRELANVPDESLAVVIERASEIAGDDRITASDLRSAKEQVLESNSQAEYEDVEPPTTDSNPWSKHNHSIALIHSLTKLGNKWLDEIRKLSKEIGGEYLAFEIQEIETKIKSIKYAMKQSCFAAICPACDGDAKKCRTCKQLGWICGASIKFLSDELKAKVPS